MRNRDEHFGYIKYELPSGTSVFLTSRPDSYPNHVVDEFTQVNKPNVRFQFTDDVLRYEVTPNFISSIPVHWYAWRPSHSLPVELVWTALQLIHSYDHSNQVMWMHCDSSSMRAPTFFGLYLQVYYQSLFDSINEPAKWTDGRQSSSLKYYSETSMDMDAGIKELVEAWRIGTAEAYKLFLFSPKLGF